MRAIRQICYSIDKGVNYVDMAWPYHGGESERLLGLALEEGYGTINHMFQMSRMTIPGSTYRNMGYGLNRGEVLEDEEGIPGRWNTNRRMDRRQKRSMHWNG